MQINYWHLASPIANSSSFSHIYSLSEPPSLSSNTGHTHHHTPPSHETSTPQHHPPPTCATYPPEPPHALYPRPVKKSYSTLAQSQHPYPLPQQANPKPPSFLASLQITSTPDPRKNHATRNRTRSSGPFPPMENRTENEQRPSMMPGVTYTPRRSLFAVGRYRSSHVKGHTRRDWYSMYPAVFARRGRSARTLQIAFPCEYMRDLRLIDRGMS